MGLFFHRENWLGGYASHKRRLYRLAHVSFFGLGATNLLFGLTAMAIGANGSDLHIASALLVLGGITMPAVCCLFAHHRKLHVLFGVPVVSLLAAATMTLLALIK